MITKKVIPLVLAMSARNPEKILIALDREKRSDCAPDLARKAVNLIQANCGYHLTKCTVSVVVSNRSFEALLFADYAAVDTLDILRNKCSGTFPDTTDERDVLSWIRPHLKRGRSYHKHNHGKELAQRLDLDSAEVQRRNCSIRKLVKDMKPRR